MRNLGLLLIPALLLGTTLGGDPSSFGSDQKIVGTYYFYWYDYNSSLHITVGGKDSLTHHPPGIESFSYLNEAWHRRELLDMIEAGIDFLLPVYWGDRVNVAWAMPGLEELVEAELSLIQEGEDPPRIGMFYDTTALMMEHRYTGQSGERPNLSTEYGRNLFYTMISDFYSTVPLDLWARVNGGAIVWLYSAGWVVDYDQMLVEYVRERFAEEYNCSLFLVRERSWNVDADMDYGWGAALGPVIRDITAIGPGFDNEGAVKCYGQSPLVRDRLGGYRYGDDWEMALRSGNNIVVIETWNELHEGTEICETVELGRQYIELTGNYSAIFRSGTWDRDLDEMGSLVSFRPGKISGRPGDTVELEINFTNNGWRSWPEKVDLSFFWLSLEGGERFGEVYRIEFPRRLTTGQTHIKTLEIVLPNGTGDYRVLVSMGDLSRRAELEASVPEAGPLVGFIWLVVSLAIFSRRSCRPAMAAGRARRELSSPPCSEANI